MFYEKLGQVSKERLPSSVLALESFLGGCHLCWIGNEPDNDSRLMLDELYSRSETNLNPFQNYYLEVGDQEGFSKFFREIETANPTPQKVQKIPEYGELLRSLGYVLSRPELFIRENDLLSFHYFGNGFHFCSEFFGFDPIPDFAPSSVAALRETWLGDGTRETYYQKLVAELE